MYSKYLDTPLYESLSTLDFLVFQSKKSNPKRGEYNVYSTFQSHEPEFDYLKSLEIEEKINKIRWLKRKNPAHFLLSTNGKYFLVNLVGDIIIGPTRKSLGSIFILRKDIGVGGWSRKWQFSLTSCSIKMALYRKEIIVSN